MVYSEIIKALVLIRDICSSKSCENCPFIGVNGICGITDQGKPSYWIINGFDNWRAFK